MNSNTCVATLRVREFAFISCLQLVRFRVVAIGDGTLRLLAAHSRPR